MQWHEIAIETGQRRRAEYLIHEPALIDAIRSVCGPRKGIALARMAPTQPRGVQRGKWRLSVWVGASRRVPRVAEELAESFAEATSRSCSVVGQRAPNAQAVTLHVRGEINVWVRPAHHGEPYTDEQLERVLGYPPTESAIQLFAGELGRSESAIREIYAIAVTRRAQLNLDMANGAFWRQVRRIAGQLGWLTVGKRELEELLRDVRSDGPARRPAYWNVGRQRGGETSYAFGLAYLPGSGFRFERVEDLSPHERSVLVKRLSSSHMVMFGGELDDGTLWDGAEEVFPGTTEHLEQCLFHLHAGLCVMEPPPSVSMEETIRRIEKNWAIAAAHEEGKKVLHTKTVCDGIKGNEAGVGQLPPGTPKKDVITMVNMKNGKATSGNTAVKIGGNRRRS